MNKYSKYKKEATVESAVLNKYGLGSWIKNNGLNLLQTAGGAALMATGVGGGLGATLIGSGVSGIIGDEAKRKQDEANEQARLAAQKSLITPIRQQLNPTGGTFAFGGEILQKFKGADHEDSGITTPYGEVENGETKIGNYIFSDRLRPEGKKKTFAQLSKHIENKYKDKTDDISKRSLLFELKKLKEKQDIVREAKMNELGLNNTGQPMYANGTPPEGIQGEPDWLNLTPEQLAYLEQQYNISLKDKRPSGDYGTFLKSNKDLILSKENIKSLKTKDISSLEGGRDKLMNIRGNYLWSTLDDNAKAAFNTTFNTPKELPEVNVTADTELKDTPLEIEPFMFNSNYFKDTKLPEVDNKKKFKFPNLGETGLGDMLGNVGKFALSNMGDIYNTVRGIQKTINPDVPVLQRVQTQQLERIDPTEGRRQLERQGLGNMRALERSGNMSGSQLRNALIASGAGTQSAIGQYTSGVQAQNATISNQEKEMKQQVNMANAGIQQAEEDLRARERDIANNMIQHGLTGLSEGYDYQRRENMIGKNLGTFANSGTLEAALRWLGQSRKG